MDRNTTSLLISIAGVLALLGGCETPEDVGQVDVALEAQGQDGAIYRLPASTFLTLSSPPIFFDRIPVGDGPTLSVDLPAGVYSWSLFLPGANLDEFPLERQDAFGAVETVTARLLNPRPDSIEIVADGRTNLAIRFEVARGGRVTFALGTADVSVEVGETDYLGGEVGWASTMAAVNVESSMPAEIAPSLPAIGDGGLSLTVVGQAGGTWTLASTSMVCAPVQIDIARGGGSEGVADLVAESAGAAQLCARTDGSIAIWMTRDGPATTDTFAPLGAAPHRFDTALISGVIAPAFDGETLDLSVLAGEHQTSMGATTEVYELDAEQATGVRRYFAYYSGEVTFRFSPGGQL